MQTIRALSIVLLALMILGSSGKSKLSNGLTFEGDTPLLQEITEDNMEDVTATFSIKSWVIILYVPNCPNCDGLSEIIEELAEKYSPQYKFGYANCQKNRGIKEYFEVNTFPSYILVSTETERIHTYRGQKSLPRISEFIGGGFRAQMAADEEQSFFSNPLDQLFDSIGVAPSILVILGLIGMMLTPCIFNKDQKKEFEKEAVREYLEKQKEEQLKQRQQKVNKKND